ncbi:MAG TPA: 30S ribosomal protein S20 [Alphaproteobacteria bacterium]|nr:30S ribosomal protein S20 [Alphaproteobacteria bacterium]
MPVHKSAIKRARQAKKRNTINRARRSTIHTLTVAVERAIASKDAKGAVEAMRKVEAALARGAGRGMLHRKTASRKTSRLTKRVKAIKSAK